MNLKVLLVDDSDLVAAMVGEALESEGFAVVRAANGADGVVMAYHEAPDVIIMDAEMPLMQGHLASRILKSRRHVRDIPIIMHTSLSEDKDKYWALSSGADDFATKDFDHLDRLIQRVRELSGEGLQPDKRLILEDAAGIDRDRVFELLGQVLDQQLFQSTVHNLLARVGRNMDSIADTARQLLELLPKVCDSQIAAIIIQYGKTPLAFIFPRPPCREGNATEFLKVCLGDFHTHFPTMDLGAIRTEYFNTENCPDYARTEQLPRLNSYTSVGLFGRGEKLTGTLHIGNTTNNYFSESVLSNIEMFAHTAGVILDNAIIFNRNVEMQDRIRRAFSKFVPQEIIDDLIENALGDRGMLTGEKREVCILFSDIRDFTQISENNRPEQVVDFLNRYFSIMVAIVKRHGGTIDKFIGDAILVIFGAPTSYQDNALRATRAAMEMMSALPEVAAGNLNLPAEGVRIGIGIHNGEAIVGNIGSSDKFNYTVIGDTVNLASRLEGLTKYYRQDILVSDAVRRRLDNSIPVWEIDTVKVKGKETATNIFSILCHPADHPDEFMDEFAKGLRMYRMGNFDTAMEYFNKAHKIKPGDHVTRIFINRCRQLREAPPDDWDGAQAMDSK